MRKILLQFFYSFIVVTLFFPFMENAHADYTLTYHDDDAAELNNGTHNNVEYSVNTGSGSSTHTKTNLRYGLINVMANNVPGGLTTQQALQPFLSGNTESGVSYSATFHQFNLIISLDSGLSMIVHGHLTGDDTGAKLDSVECSQTNMCWLRDDGGIQWKKDYDAKTVSAKLVDTGIYNTQNYTSNVTKQAGSACIQPVCTSTQYTIKFTPYTKYDNAVTPISTTLTGKGRIAAYEPVVYVRNISNGCSLTYHKSPSRSGDETCDLFTLIPAQDYAFNVSTNLTMTNIPNTSPFSLIFSGGVNRTVNLYPNNSYASTTLQHFEANEANDPVKISLSVPASTGNTYSAGTYKGTLEFTVTLL